LTKPIDHFKVLPTGFHQRRLARGGYIVAVNESAKSKHGLGRSAIVIHQTEAKGTFLMLGLMCSLVLDNDLGDDEARLDQTVRNAIGIPFKYEPHLTNVQILPLGRSRTLGDYATELLRRRYVILRVHKINIPDMEKNLGRCERSLLEVLSVQPGNRIVIEAWNHSLSSPSIKRVSVRALGVEEGFLEERAKLETADLEGRFPKASALLGVEPDIKGLYLDSHERAILGVGSLDPVRVRCNVIDLVAREFTEFGLLFFVTLFSLSQILPIKGTWFTLAVTAIGSLLLSLVTVIAKLRAR
jgi:hypothetical protein